MKIEILILLLFAFSSSLAQKGEWQILNTEFNENLYGISFTDSLTGWICGENGLMLHTTDGENWAQQTTPVTVNLYDVFFINDSKGWACGDSGVVIRTNDSGEVWEIVVTPIDDRKLSAIEFTQISGSLYGYSVGDTSSIATPDGGDTWYGGSTPIMFYDVTFWDPYDGFRGCFLTPFEMQCTEDFGSTWEWVGVFEFLQFGIIRKDLDEFVWENNCWTVGHYGTAYYNYYPGDSYPFILSQTPDTLDLYEGDVDEMDSTIWAVGELGEIIYSLDYGVTYSKYPSPTIKNLYDVEFPGKETGYAVGDSGTLLKYNGDWISTGNLKRIFHSSKLEVIGIPNPFKENITIRLLSSNEENLKIYVYNSFGILVKKIFNDKVLKGQTEITWNGRNEVGQKVSNGIYFVRVISKNGIIMHKILKQ